MSTSLALSNANAFAARGYPVLPLHSITERGGHRVCTCGDATCSSPGKHPHARLAPHGAKDATTDLRVINKWFADLDWLNYGVVTDTLPTVDIDPRHGGDDAWLKLIRQHHDVHSWRVSTGGGGQHIIFGSVSTPVPNGKLARGVDVKGAGGYIVGAGSLHVSGKRYAWFPQCKPGEVELAAPPPWVLEQLEKPKQGKDGNRTRTPAYYRELIAPALEGERNDRIARLFGHLYGSMFPDRVVLCGLVVAWNRLYCEPPLTDSEVIAIARNIAGCESRKREV
jgi:putative DNA primase/helicase